MNRMFQVITAKKAIRKKTFLIPLILVIALTLGNYLAINQNEKNNNVATSLTMNIVSAKQQLSKMDKHDPEYGKFLRRLKDMKGAVAAYDVRNWRLVAQNKMRVIQFDVDYAKFHDISLKDDPGYLPGQLEMKTLKYVANNNVYPNRAGMGVQGLNYTFDHLGFIYSVITLPIVLFMLSTIFSDKFQGKKNFDVLYPENWSFFEFNRLLVAFGVNAIVYLMVIGTSLVIASIFHGSGEFDYPLYYAVGGTIAHVTIGMALIKSILLQFLSVLGVIALLQLLTNIFKNQILAILLTLLITLPQVVAPLVFDSLDNVMQLIPGTYIAATNVINGYWPETTNNYLITFGNGILVSTLYLMVLVIINVVYNRVVADND